MPMDCIPSVRTVYYASWLYSFFTDCVLCQWTVFLLYGLSTMPKDCILLRPVFYANGLDSFCLDFMLCLWTSVGTEYYANGRYFFCTYCMLCQ